MCVCAQNTFLCCLNGEFYFICNVSYVNMFKTGRIRDIKAQVSYSFKRTYSNVSHTGRHTILREVRGFRDSRMHKHNMSGSLSRQSSAPANGGHALVRSSQSRHTSRCSGRRRGPALLL